MLNPGRQFRGDTLIEVTIAIGIFALVAISVVAVVNISTSGAQSALENTLAREEVDSQVETLRFIQSAYVNDSNLDSTDADNNSKMLLYKAIWEAVTKNADSNMVGNAVNADFSREFKPETCGEIYDKSDGSLSYLEKQHAFIIDIRKLNSYDSLYGEKDVAKFADEVVISASGASSGLFSAAITYPRLVYKKNDSLDDLYEDALFNDGSYDVLDKVEGIYIVGVRDANTTTIVTDNSIEDASAYYDFYVRSCWYNTGSEVPSTVSTLVRLRDPDSISYVEPSGGEPESEPDEHLYMQDFTLAQCRRNVNSDNVGSNIKVYDRRDESDYTVRYINGQCWMTQNLRIQGIISATDSNFDRVSNFNVSQYDLTNTAYCSGNGAGYINACSHLGVDNYGNATAWYNYAAASAGQIAAYESLADATQDVCPSGWHLPSGPGDVSGTDFNRLIGDAAAQDYHQMTTIGSVAFDAVGGSFYSEGIVGSSVSYGYWWSSSAYDASMWGSSYYRPVLDCSAVRGSCVGNIANYRYYGSYIRCVLKD